MLRTSIRLPLFLCVLVCHSAAYAQLYELPLAEIIQRSDLIAEGRVVARQSFWDNDHRNIYTTNTVEITATYQGAALATPLVQVITAGGVVDDRMELVSELVQYGVGDVGLFCLIPCARDLPVAPAWENYGSPHGFFYYHLAGNTVEHPFHPASDIPAFRKKIEALVQNPMVPVPGKSLDMPAANRMPPAISSFSPTSVSAGTGDVLTITGTGFGSTPGSVRFINSNTGTNFTADANDLISWTDTQIEITVPSTAVGSGCAGTGPITVVDQGGATGVSATNLTVEFGYTNFISSNTKYGAKLVTTNGTGGLTFTLSTTICNSSNQDAVNAIGRALREWRCTSGVNWPLSTSTTSTNAPAADGTNIITFDVGSPLPGGVLGVATSYFSGCFSGGDFRWWVSEIDINLKQNVNWYYCDAASVPGSSFDFQTVVFHELGHGHQLTHIVDPSATMHRSIGAGQAKRTLNAFEQSGADYVIGLPANPCGPGPMTLLSHPACLGLTPPSACNSAGACTLSLPVELVQFTGKAEAGSVLLEWATATERNNHYFTLERSTNASHFEPVANVPGVGHSTTPQQYQHRDLEPLPGLNYYRLRQTDFDGKTTLLGMIAVQARENLQYLRAFPNPVSGETLHIDIVQTDAEATVELMLTDLLGRVVRRYHLDANTTTTEISLHALPPGTYLLTAYQHDSRQRPAPILLIKM